MRRFAIGLLALSVAAICSTSAHAGALNRLDFDGEPDVLNDTDWEAFVERNEDGDFILSRDGDDTIDVGDIIIGVFEVSDEIDGDDVNTGEDTFLAVLAARVASVDRNGDSTTGDLAFAPVGGTNAAGDYADLITTFGLPSRTSTSSAILVYDGQLGDLDPTGWTTVNDAFGEVVTGNPLLAEFGPVDPDDFATGDLLTGTLKVSDIDSAIEFLFKGGLGVTHNATSVTFLPHDRLAFGVENVFQFSGNNATIDDGVPPFDIKTQTEAAINAVPEPTSLTLLALGGIGLVGAGYRRRRAARKKAA